MVAGANPTIYALSRAGIWAYENPAETAVLAYAVRYAPAKTGLVAIEVGKYTAKTMPARLAMTRNIGTIVIGSRGIATLKIASKAGMFGAAAALGLGVGVVAGTAISRAAFGVEGKDLAIDYYTGQAKWYEYIPHYNAGRIVKHYVAG